MKIGVVGCGVGGMAAALALSRLGHDVTILERFAAPRPLGAGLLLQPNGLAALSALGLRSAVEAMGARIAALQGRTRGGRLVLNLRYQRWREGAYGLGIHRGALFGALYEAVQQAGVSIVTSAEITALEDEARPVALCGGGRRYGPFELLIVADGAHSHLRQLIAPGAKDHENRWAALWLIHPDPDRQWTEVLNQRYHGAGVMMGVLPIGQAPGEDPGLNHVAIFWSLRADRYPAWRAAGLSAWKQELHAHWPAAAKLIDDLDDPAEIAFSTYRDVRAKPWRKGRILMLGDAAHGTSPQLGQGANLALADGVQLGALLHQYRDDPDTALAAFEAARRPWTGWTQTLSRLLTPAFQHDWAPIGWARDLALPIAHAIAPLERLMLTTLTGAAAFPHTKTLPKSN